MTEYPINGPPLPEGEVDTARIIYHHWADAEPANEALAECHRAGAKDLTLAEVEQAYEKLTSEVGPVLENLRKVLRGDA